MLLYTCITTTNTLAVDTHHDCSSGGSDPTSARGAGREPPCACEPARYETSKSTRRHQR
jgi:hypothetical protein